MWLIILIILWVAFTMFADETLDLLVALLKVADFFAMVLRVALLTIAKSLWFLLSAVLRLAWRGLRLGFTFLYFLAAELLRGQAPASEDGDDREDEEEEQDQSDLYAAARTLLGLPENFTRTALDSAYKRAIKKAHPDIGGSLDEAQAINMARDLLLRRLGTV